MRVCIPRVNLCFDNTLESVEVKLIMEVLLQRQPCCWRIGLCTTTAGATVLDEKLGRGVGTFGLLLQLFEASFLFTARKYVSRQVAVGL